MADTKRLLELALTGLHAELVKINQEIANLESQFRRSKGTSQSKGVVAVRRGNGKGTGRKSHMTAAGRKALSDAAKRRWIASKKAGKSTL